MGVCLLNHRFSLSFFLTSFSPFGYRGFHPWHVASLAPSYSALHVSVREPTGAIMRMLIKCQSLNINEANKVLLWEGVAP